MLADLSAMSPSATNQAISYFLAEQQLGRQLSHSSEDSRCTAGPRVSLASPDPLQLTPFGLSATGILAARSHCSPGAPPPHTQLHASPAPADIHSATSELPHPREGRSGERRRGSSGFPSWLKTSRVGGPGLVISGRFTILKTDAMYFVLHSFRANALSTLPLLPLLNVPGSLLVTPSPS